MRNPLLAEILNGERFGEIFKIIQDPHLVVFSCFVE